MTKPSLLARLGSFARGVAAHVRLPRDPLFYLSERQRLAIGGMPQGGAYGYHPTVYRAVKVLADALASMPYRLHRVTRDGSDPITVGPWARLFSAPNPLIDEVELWQLTATHVLTEGACGWFLEGDAEETPLLPDQMPSSIYPLSGRLFAPYFDTRTGVRRFVAWLVTDPVTGRQVKYPIDQVVLFRFIAPENPYGWQSPLRAAGSTIRQDTKAAAWNEAFFDNGAEPGGILSTDQPLQEREVKAMHKEWWDQHGGASRAHRIAVLSNGVSYQPTASTHTEMAFGEQTKANTRRIAGVLGVPLWFLGESEDLSYATAKSAERILYTSGVIPLADLLARRADSRLLQKRDPLARLTTKDAPGSLYGVFDTADVEALRDDLVNRLGAAKQYRDLGVPMRHVNDLLELNIPEEALAGWGDVPLLPFGLMPATDLIAPPEPPAMEGEPILPGSAGEAPVLPQGGSEQPVLPSGQDGSEAPEGTEEPGAVLPGAGPAGPILPSGRTVLAVGLALRLADSAEQAVQRVAELGLDADLARVERGASGWVVMLAEPDLFDRDTFRRLDLGDGVALLEAEPLADDGGWGVCAHGRVAHPTPRLADLSQAPHRARRLRAWNRIVRTVMDPNERRFLRLARQHLARVFRDVLAAVPDPERAPQDASEAAAALERVVAESRERWDQALQGLAQGAYARIAADSLASLEGELKGDFQKVTTGDPDVADFLRTKRIKLARDVNGTLAEEVRGVATRGVAEGWTVKEVRQGLERQAGIAYQRARTIARTETSQATNAVRNVAMTKAGVSAREWLASGDQVVRETHLWLDGKMAPLRGVYPVPPSPEWRGPALRYPSDVNGDPAQIINCRCSEGAVIEP